MSQFFDQASLVMVPSGYKDGKVYSQKPLSTDGELTFTRASSATRVASNGLIERVRTNLYPSNIGAFVGYTPGPNAADGGQVAGPTGAMNARSIIYSALSNAFINYEITLSAGKYTFSMFVRLASGTAQNRPFILGSSSVYMNALPTSTWTRVYGTFDYVGGTDNVVFPYYDSICTLEYSQIQIETGDIATDYIATTTAAVSVGPVANLPRLDYLGSSCGKLLLEPQRTNSQRASEQIDNALYWSFGGGSISANLSVSPDGYQNADKFVESAATERHELYSEPVAFSGTSSVSIFAKDDGRRYFSTLVGGDPNSGGATFDLQTGVISATSGGTTASITPYGNDWYRCSFTTTATTSSQVYFCLRTTDSAPTVETYAGDGTSGLYIWGAQTELAGAYASSYIPTLGAAVTRGADAASKTSATALIGQTEGTAFIEFNIDNLSESGGEKVLFYMKDTGVGERYLSLVNNGNLTYVEYNGAIIANITKSSMAIGNHKAAIAYANNDFVLYVDGVLAGSDTSGTPNGYSTFGLQYYSASVIGKQSVSQALLFKTRLSNADLATLTA